MKQIIIFLTLVLSFSLYATDKTKTISLSISGMSCQSCANTVEKALIKVNGVKEATVDLLNNSATITVVNKKTTTAILIKAVSDAGFEAEGKKSPTTREMKKQPTSQGDNCGDGCCGKEGDSKEKMKKINEKKS